MVTTAKFARQAIELAKKTNFQLVDRSALLELINQISSDSILEFDLRAYEDQKEEIEKILSSHIKTEKKGVCKKRRRYYRRS